jgi:hypothetical protein
MSPRHPPTETPHLVVRLSRKSDTSVGDQSRSQLAGRGRSVFQLLCSRRQVTPFAAPPQLMLPEGLLKWNVRPAGADGRPRAWAANTAARASARTTAAERGDTRADATTAARARDSFRPAATPMSRGRAWLDPGSSHLGVSGTTSAWPGTSAKIVPPARPMIFRRGAGLIGRPLDSDREVRARCHERCC